MTADEAGAAVANRSFAIAAATRARREIAAASEQARAPVRRARAAKRGGGRRGGARREALDVSARAVVARGAGAYASTHVFIAIAKAGRPGFARAAERARRVGVDRFAQVSVARLSFAAWRHAQPIEAELLRRRVGTPRRAAVRALNTGVARTDGPVRVAGEPPEEAAIVATTSSYGLLRGRGHARQARVAQTRSRLLDTRIEDAGGALADDRLTAVDARSHRRARTLQRTAVCETTRRSARLRLIAVRAEAEQRPHHQRTDRNGPFDARWYVCCWLARSRESRKRCLDVVMARSLCARGSSAQRSSIITRMRCASIAASAERCSNKHTRASSKKARPLVPTPWCMISADVVDRTAVRAFCPSRSR
jgi:hypothetical protein